MQNFELFDLPKELLISLHAMNYSTPTPIQAEAIPIALNGEDILGTAQTGTGKTAAYGLPLIAHLLKNSQDSALILTPTRELAIQVLQLLEKMLGKQSKIIKSVLLIGGDAMPKQLSLLRAKPRLIVGTPGRINDHLKRGTLKLDTTKFLVLDETDRMLDLGFGIQLDEIVKFLPRTRQTLMFSATLPKNIQNLAAQYLTKAVRVSVGSTISIADTIEQEIICIKTEQEKHDILLDQLTARSGSCIIFVKTKMATENLAKRLRDIGHTADAIHGDLRQRQRERVIRFFRNKKNRILVATDVAARGLDIPHIEHVVNYDLPQCEEDFIHRVGRAGRAGLKGNAISIITPQDHQKWRNICKMMNIEVKLPKDFVVKTEGSRRNEKKRFFDKSDSSFRPSRRFSDNQGAKRSGAKFERRDEFSAKASRSFPNKEGSAKTGVRFDKNDSASRSPKKFFGGQSAKKSSMNTGFKKAR